jgi:hypothetical protein
MGQKGVVRATGQDRTVRARYSVRGVGMHKKLWPRTCRMALGYDKLEEWHIT